MHRTTFKRWNPAGRFGRGTLYPMQGDETGLM